MVGTRQPEASATSRNLSSGAAPLRLHDITEIQSNENAFAARRGTDGAVIAWGSERDGGALPTDMDLRDTAAGHGNAFRVGWKIQNMSGISLAEAGQVSFCVDLGVVKKCHHCTFSRIE